MADRRGVLIPLLILTWFFFGPDPVRQSAARLQQQPSIEHVIAEEERSLWALRNSSYGDLDSPWGNVLNLTGLEDDRGYAWKGLQKVQERAKGRLQYALGDAGLKVLEGHAGGDDLPPLYSNVTGHVHGHWVRSKLQDNVLVPPLNLSNYAPMSPFGPLAIDTFGRNITGADGDVRMRFHERTPYDADTITGAANVTGISAEMTLQDFQSGEEIDLELYGVYNMQIGQAVMTTTSNKMAGIFMLPHFTISEHTFESARKMLNQSISRTIRSQKAGSTLSLNPWSSSVEDSTRTAFEAPQCELILYLQQLPPSGSRTVAVSSKVLAFLERESRFPTGAFLPSAPELRFSMLAFSPDCGYVLESKGEPDYVPQDGHHLTGPKIEVLQGRGRHHLLLFAVTIGGQFTLLMRQMREANTSSTRSRMSFYSISLLALGDGFVGITFLFIGLAVRGLWINLVATAFLAFLSVMFFGMRFLLDIWTAQAPERAIRAREEAEEERQRQERFRSTLERLRAERLQREAASEETPASPVTPAAEPSADVNALAPPPARTDPAESDPAQSDPAQSDPAQSDPALPLLPLPVTAQRPTDTGAAAVFMPSDQEGLVTTQTGTGNMAAAEVEASSTSFGSIYIRFYLVLFATLFITLNAISWPTGLRRAYFTVLALISLSFWVPQIRRNVQRNCRKALTLEFVVGQSLLRMVPFIYFYAYKENVLFAEPQPYILLALAVWLWIQVLLLASQEFFGPRWFIRHDWAPPAYDYHPILREDEEGATMPLGLSEATSGSAPTSPLVERRASLSSPTTRRGSIAKEAKGKGKRVYNCAICFQDLEVPVVEAGGSSDTTVAGILARRSYMVTACRHIFHSPCLEGWMKYRLQCPICRETLPPFVSHTVKIALKAPLQYVLPIGRRFPYGSFGRLHVCTLVSSACRPSLPTLSISSQHAPDVTQHAHYLHTHAMKPSISDWVCDQKHTLHETPPPPYESPLDYDLAPTQPSKHALDAALSHLALAIAALYRAGPFYKRQSENLWFFAAGSWSREEYGRQVEKAGRGLPKKESVVRDVGFAEGKLREAVDVLWREGDARDARDLVEAVGGFKAGCQ
ncbi:hypothetical protein LTR91_002199 [Friedmanniomyces endolithicus]|uniref:DSC E3 ubiquitin ligase complex subunit A n=2 Tax=Friedmanniomyces endolithicus TaxID=329885 RepID=A0AAN6FHH5_9PEZI|nr:hypothetical protein LTR82_010765 [Friedmanniomyces endolithicus]KAK0909144.1 hypothetical protein LTR57_016503 [Friedmanniomyces endolithicus]KAK1010915.1 hypothetical protein LTR91_002199 [Friedmanniomyces endolithicus]